MIKKTGLEKSFEMCEANGMFIPLENVDFERIKSMLEIVNEDKKAVIDLKKGKRWNSLYKISYDVIHTLCEALLLSDKVKSQNHKCLFAYICKNYSSENFEWDFFEVIRIKRNGIHYYGSQVIEKDFKEIEEKLYFYINKLEKLVGKKIS